MIDDYAVLVAKLDVAFCRACGIAWPEIEERLHSLRMAALERQLRREMKELEVAAPSYLWQDYDRQLRYYAAHARRES